MDAWFEQMLPSKVMRSTMPMLPLGAAEWAVTSILIPLHLQNLPALVCRYTLLVDRHEMHGLQGLMQWKAEMLEHRTDANGLFSVDLHLTQ